MFKLSSGYLISGAITGLILLFSFLTTLPDGRLHIIFCNVGQGDASYVKFPDGRDMLIDSGPDKTVVNCLGRHMPFWDRTIDLMVLSHPQKDHLNGFLAVLPRYHVKYFVHSQVDNTTDGYKSLKSLISQNKVAEKLVTYGDVIDISLTRLSVIWPSKNEISLLKSANVLGAQTNSNNVNDASVVIHLRFGTFDALFPGDADERVDPIIVSQVSDIPDCLEVLKVPHHGAKTGMTDKFISWIYPKMNLSKKCSDPPSIIHNPFSNACPLAVISVGKNSFGHPATETISRINAKGVAVMRTDKFGDIEIISNGKTWKVKPQHDSVDK
jgi:competence protein ComEC